MALDALKRGYVTQIHGMFEWLVGFVTGLALPILETTEIDRMHDWSLLDSRRHRGR